MEKSTLNQIIERGELRVGMEPGYMPFEMKDKKGNIIGFDVDFAKKMAKDMGVKLKLVPTTWDGIIAALIIEKYDIIMSGMTITQSRNLKINFADPYIVVGQTMMMRKELSGKVKVAKDLDKAEYTIATKLGVTGEIAARKFFKKAKIALVKDSSLVSVISITDLTKVGKEIVANTFSPFETWIVIALVYLSITFTMSYIGHRLEKRMAAKGGMN